MAKKKKSEESDVDVVEEKSFMAGFDFKIALGLFVLAFVIRFYFLNAGLWYTDAVIAAQVAELTYESKALHYMHGVGYPGQVITVTLLYALFKLFGASSAEFATLFSSMFFASLTVGLIYILVKKLMDSTFAALSAALVLNVLPVYLSTSTFGMSHQLSSFFIVLSFYLALLASKSKNHRLMVLASASLGWASAVRLESLQMLPLMILFYWKNNAPFSFGIKEGYFKFKMNQSKEKLVKDLTYLILPLVLMSMIPYMPMFKESGVKTLWDAFQYNRWLGFWVDGLTPLVISWVSISMTQLGWILLLAGLVALLLKKDKHIFLVVLVWCAYFFVLANTLTVEDRHTIPALIGFTVAIGFGLDWVYARIHKIVGVAVLLLLLGLMSSTIYPILEYRSNFCGPKSFAYTVKDVVEENSVVIVMDEAPHLQYYGGINTIGHPLDGDMIKIEQNMRELDDYLDNGTSVYLVSTAFVYDTPMGLSYNSVSGKLYDPQSGMVYENILYSPSTQSFTDTSSGVRLPLYGKWQVELFSNFMVIPIKTVENEDWHKKSVMFGKFDEVIFKITKRP